MAIDFATAARVLDEDYAPFYRPLPSNDPTRNQSMSNIYGHKCDRCGKQKLTDNSGAGPREVNRDGYGSDLPKGWLIVQAYPASITMCKGCQKRAGLR